MAKPESTFYDPGYCIAYGKRVNNFDTSSPFGRIALFDALVHSVNSVFCNIGQTMGARKILRTAKRFGFYELPPLETPASERRASGLYQNGKLFDPSRDSDVDAGRMAFGQERLLVSPLQMAMVAGTIGNGGILMEPHVVDRIVSPKGKIVARGTATKLGRAVTPATARDVGAMMVAAVQRGQAPLRNSRATSSAARRARPRPACRASTTPGSSPTPACRARSPGSRSRSWSRTSPTVRAAASQPRSRRPSWRHCYARRRMSESVRMSGPGKPGPDKPAAHAAGPPTGQIKL